MTQSTLLQLKWNNTLALLKLHNKEGKKSEGMTNPKAAQKIIIKKNEKYISNFIKHMFIRKYVFFYLIDSL